MLAEQFLHRLAVVDQLHRPLQRGHDFLVRVDAQGVADRWRAGRLPSPAGPSGITPSSSDEPITWPPLTPPPANRQLNTDGWWSRPAVLLIFGVRPNSLSMTIIVFFSMPDCGQVFDQRRPGPGPSPRRGRAWPGSRSMCVSNPPRLTCTNRTPFSTRRRASSAAAAELGVAVALQHFGLLLVDLERLQGRAAHQLDGVRQRRSGRRGLLRAAGSARLLLVHLGRMSSRLLPRTSAMPAGNARYGSFSPGRPTK